MGEIFAQIKATATDRTLVPFLSISHASMSQYLPALDEVIDRSPLTAPPETPVRVAIAQLHQCSASCVLVVEATKVVGIFTRGNVLKLMAAGVDLAQTNLKTGMTSPVIGLRLSPDQTVITAFSLMQQHQIRHLPILDDRGQLLGLVTQDVLIRVLDPVNLVETQVSQGAAALQIFRSIKSSPAENEPVQGSCEALVSPQTPENPWKELFDHALDAILIADNQGCYLDANPAACKLFGLPRAELLGSSIANFANPELDVKPIWQQFLQQRQMSGEFSLHRPDGTIRETEFAAIANFIPGCHLSIVRDISDRKQLERSLQASERKVSRILDSEIAAFVSFRIFTDRHWEYEYHSAGYEKLFGYSREELSANPNLWWSRVFPADRETVLIPLFEALFTKTNLTAEYRFYHKDGAVRWISSTYASEQIEPDCWRITALSQEITERKQAEMALSQSEERFRISQDLSLDPFTILESVRNEAGVIIDFVWTYANPKAAAVLMRSVDELMGQRLLDVLPGNQTDSELFERYVRVVETGESHDLEIPYNSDGITGWFRNMAVKLKDGVAISFSDITERKQAEARLKTALKEKVLLLKETHHRLKNNLEIVASLLTLQADQTENADARSILQESQERIYAIALVHEHLYKSTNLSQVDFSTYARDLVENIFITWGNANLHLHLSMEPIILNLETALPCGLLLNELVSNALKHGFPNQAVGDIWVQFKQVGDSFLLLVKDNGIGFPPDLNFRQTESLGMQLVCDLTQQLNGTFSIKPLEENTTALQPGTCCQLYFRELNYSKRL